MNHVDPADLTTFSLFSGTGMLDEAAGLALELFGRRTRPVGYVERDSGAAAALLARMEESSMEPAPVWCGDVAEVPWRKFRGLVDVLTAGFPCQPWSHAGDQEGVEDDRWLWPEVARAIREMGPWLVLLENVPGLISGNGLEPVLDDLAALGLDAEWLSLSGRQVGASHQRERVFIVAYAKHHARCAQWFRRSRKRRDPQPGLVTVPRRDREELAESEGRGLRSVRKPSGSEGQPERGNEGLADPAEQRRAHEIGEAQDPRRTGARVADPGGAGLPEREGQPGDQREELAPVERARVDLEHPDGGRQRQSGGQHAPESGFDLADPAGERERPVGQPAGRLEARDPEWTGDALGHVDPDSRGGMGPGPGPTSQTRPSGPVVDPAGPRREGREGSGPAADPGGRPRVFEPGCPGLFAPGPAAPEWGDIVRHYPNLQPSVEPGFCVLVDGLAVFLDSGRTDALRAAGNGVVAVCGAAAFGELLSRIIHTTHT